MNLKSLKLGETVITAAQSPKEAIIELFKKNPKPNDSEVHKLADDLGIKPDELENTIYSMLSDYINKATAAFDPKQLDMAVEVEKEHKDTILQIIKDAKEGTLKPLEEYYKGIGKDHLKEIENYYTWLIDMEKKAKS